MRLAGWNAALEGGFQTREPTPHPARPPRRVVTRRIWRPGSITSATREDAAAVALQGGGQGAGARVLAHRVDLGAQAGVLEASAGMTHSQGP